MGAYLAVTINLRQSLMLCQNRICLTDWRKVLRWVLINNKNRESGLRSLLIPVTWWFSSWFWLHSFSFSNMTLYNWVATKWLKEPHELIMQVHKKVCPKKKKSVQKANGVCYWWSVQCKNRKKKFLPIIPHFTPVSLLKHILS